MYIKYWAIDRTKHSFTVEILHCLFKQCLFKAILLLYSKVQNTIEIEINHCTVR